MVSYAVVVLNLSQAKGEKPISFTKRTVSLFTLPVD